MDRITHELGTPETWSIVAGLLLLLVAAALPPKAIRIVLDERGKPLSSEAFAKAWPQVLESVMAV